MPQRKTSVRVQAVLLNAAGLETQRYEGLAEAMAEAKHLADAGERPAGRPGLTLEPAVSQPPVPESGSVGGVLTLDTLKPAGKATIS